MINEAGGVHYVPPDQSVQYLVGEARYHNCVFREVMLVRLKVHVIYGLCNKATC